ncbi:MAG: hypothetical protein J0M17_14315 [Planctomycetes bacterium]|nr:hypothetical protein [Planctomycetota bacterium]
MTINGLGLAADRPLKKRKYDLTRCIETLLEHRIITLGRGQTSVKELFYKREKGRYVVVFYKGPYFEKAIAEGSKKDVTDDPLFGPMQSIGVDEPMIRKVLKNCQRSIIERWLKITEAATKDKPAGFPGFKVSPAAFFVDGVLNERMPPDWMYQLEKSQRQKAHEAELAKMKAVERLLQADYERQRREALKTFVQTPTGRKLYQAAYDFRLAFNLRQGDPSEVAQRNADAEALEYLGRSDEFSFPEMSVWMLAEKIKS